MYLIGIFIKTLVFFMDGVQLPQDYIATTQETIHC